MDEIGYMMAQIFLLLLFAELLGLVMKKIKMPEMVGYILGGIIFVNLAVFVPSFGEALHFDIYSVEGDEDNFLNIMGQIGLVFLMFGIGLKTRLSDLLDVGKTAIIVAFCSILIPFAGGFGVYFLFGDDFNVALMVGTAIFASSTTITVNMLNHLGITDSSTGKLIIGLSIIVDIICLILLAVNSTLINPSHEHAWWMNTLVILIFICLIFVFIARTKHRGESRRHLMEKFGLDQDDVRKGLFVIAIVTCFGFTAFSYVVGLSGIVGAFLAGMYFAEFESSSHIREKFDTLTRFLLPFFFLYVGLRLHFDVMGSATLVFALVLFVVAIVTKFAGGWVGCRLCKMDSNDSAFVASCILARGDIAIIVATLAHSQGIFGTDLYAAIIVMAAVTQIVAPMIIKKTYSKSGISKGAVAEE